MFLTLCGRGRCLSSKLSTTVKVTTRFGQTNRYAGYPQFTLSKSPLTTRINSCGKYRANQTNPPSIQHICGFRTSQQNRAFHPVIWVLLKPALKIVTVITSRVYRQWFKDLPRWKKIMYVLTYVSVVGLPLILMYHLYNSNQVTPITNRKQFIILTPEQVLKVSEFEAEQHITQFKDKMLPATHPFYQPLLWVAQRLLQANQDLPILKDLKWKLCIVEDSALNAFVLPHLKSLINCSESNHYFMNDPNRRKKDFLISKASSDFAAIEEDSKCMSGHVFFTTAILEMMENEDQLAVVFGHEMAHAVCSHSIEALSKSQFMDYCIIFFMTAIWTIIPSDGIAIITQYFMEKIMHYTFTLTFSRELEEEADVVGLEMAAKACFDVREGSVLWRRMMMIRDLTGTKGLEFTSTHPSNENRITTMEKLLSKTIAIRDACNCPKLPDLDPRIRAKAIQKKVDNVVIARKAGQNLALVPKVTSSGRIITQK